MKRPREPVHALSLPVALSPFGLSQPVPLSPFGDALSQPVPFSPFGDALQPIPMSRVGDYVANMDVEVVSPVEQQNPGT